MKKKKQKKTININDKKNINKNNKFKKQLNNKSKKLSNKKKIGPSLTKDDKQKIIFPKQLNNKSKKLSNKKKIGPSLIKDDKQKIIFSKQLNNKSKKLSNKKKIGPSLIKDDNQKYSTLQESFGPNFDDVQNNQQQNNNISQDVLIQKINELIVRVNRNSDSLKTLNINANEAKKSIDFFKNYTFNSVLARLSKLERVFAIYEESRINPNFNIDKNNTKKIDDLLNNKDINFKNNKSDNKNKKK